MKGKSVLDAIRFTTNKNHPECRRTTYRIELRGDGSVNVKSERF